MEDAHLSVEVLAKWLSGRLEPDEALTLVIPHFLEQCPVCRERHAEIVRLQEVVGHWDPEVVVWESREAPELWTRLAGQSYEEQVRSAEEDESFHTWGFCQLLLDNCLQTGFEDPERAVHLANLAVKVAGHLGDAYDPNWVFDLRARTFAYLGNALRVLGELRGAEDAFRKAEKCLARSTSGNSQVEAEVLDLKGSLRRAQRRFDQALQLVERSLVLYREGEDRHGIAIALVKRAKILDELGDCEKAIELLRTASGEIDLAEEPQLFSYARFNLVNCLAKAGRYREAERFLPEIREIFRHFGQTTDLLRLRWTEGLIDLGLDRSDTAEAAFLEVQQEFLARQMGYDAALVSLDLALLYAQEGREADLKRLASELMPIFQTRDVHREAILSLLLFQRACEEEYLTVEMVRELAAHLRRERGGQGG